MKKKIGKFYDILTTEGGGEATILLYGYIGEEYSIGEEGWEMSGTTDTGFLKELDRLSESYSRINVRINSYGGEIFHGMPIISAMQRCKAEIHTYIDGLAASMAGVIWLAGKHRHMAKNAMLMLHSSSNICWGNAKDMRETADILDQFSKTMAIAIADSTGQTVEDIQQKYFADYADHWMTHDEVAAESNFITDTDDYSAEMDMPTAISAMKYKDVMAYFKGKEAAGHDKQTIMQQVKSVVSEIRAAFISPTPQPVIQSQTNNQDMTLEEFKASVADGTLNLDDVRAILDATTPAPSAAEETPAIKALQTQVETLTASLSAFLASPGAAKSEPGMPESDHPTADGAITARQRYDAANAKLRDAADSGEQVKFSIQ